MNRALGWFSAIQPRLRLGANTPPGRTVIRQNRLRVCSSMQDSCCWPGWSFTKSHPTGFSPLRISQLSSSRLRAAICRIAARSTRTERKSFAACPRSASKTTGASRTPSRVPGLRSAAQAVRAETGSFFCLRPFEGPPPLARPGDRDRRRVEPEIRILAGMLSSSRSARAVHGAGTHWWIQVHSKIRADLEV